MSDGSGTSGGTSLVGDPHTPEVFGVNSAEVDTLWVPVVQAWQGDRPLPDCVGASVSLAHCSLGSRAGGHSWAQTLAPAGWYGQTCGGNGDPKSWDRVGTCDRLSPCADVQKSAAGAGPRWSCSVLSGM